MRLTKKPSNFNVDNFKEKLKEISVIQTAVVLFLLSLFIGAVFEYHKPQLLNKTKKIVGSGLLSLYLRTFPQTTIPTININIKFLDLQKIEYKKALVLSLSKDLSQNSSVMMSSDDDYVPVKLDIDNKKFKANMRLKGDWIDHLITERSSFRIKLKGDNRFLGMEKFSLQSPSARGRAYEWLYLNTLKAESLISLRYQFARVSINGNPLGLYVIEEFFDKYLIENNALREGPILKFQEDFLWQNRLFQLAQNQGIESDIIDKNTTLQSDMNTHFKHSKILPFSMGSIFKNHTQTAFLKRARHLLHGFRTGTLNAHQVFDTQKLAHYLAITDLFGGSHSYFWHNLRFYYNPVTSKLEPIGFDAGAGPIIHSLAKHQVAETPSFYQELFNDPTILSAYNNALEQVCQEGYIDKLWADIQTQTGINFESSWAYRFLNKAQKNPLFFKSFQTLRLDLFFFTKQSLINNQKQLKKNLNLKENSYQFFVAGHVYGKQDKTQIGLYPPFLEALKKLKTNETLQFGVFTGDMVQHGTEEEFENLIQTINTFKKPIYIAPGNHDYRLENSHSFFKAQTKSIQIKNDSFLFFDSIDASAESITNQINELEKILAKKPNRLFIFMHSMLWNKEPKYRYLSSVSNAYYKANGYASPLWEQIKPLLLQAEIPIYIFSGDTGVPKSTPIHFIQEKNLQLITSGMGGHKNDNYLLVNVSPYSHQITVMPLTNSSLNKNITAHHFSTLKKIQLKIKVLLKKIKKVLTNSNDEI